MIFLANYWQPADGQRNPVVVYSNCEEVELFINGRSVGRRRAGQRAKRAVRRFDRLRSELLEVRRVHPDR